MPCHDICSVPCHTYRTVSCCATGLAARSIHNGIVFFVLGVDFLNALPLLRVVVATATVAVGRVVLPARRVVQSNILRPLFGHGHAGDGFVLAVRQHFFLHHEAVSFFVAPVGVGRQFDNVVQRDRHVRGLLSIQAHEIGVQNPQDALVADNQEGFPDAFHFLRQGFQPERHVHVGFSPWIPIAELVGLPPREFVRKDLLDFLVGHSVAGSGVQLVQIPAWFGTELAPLEVVSVVKGVVKVGVLDELRRFAGSSHGAGPQPAGAFLLLWFFAVAVAIFVRLVLFLISGPSDFFLGKDRQPPCVLQPSGCEAGIPPDLAQQVVLGLPVPRQVKRPWHGVQIHDKVNDLQREIPANVVHHVPVGVDDLAKGSVVFLYRFVVFFVVGPAVHEIGHRLGFFHSLVIGCAEFDLVDVGQQNGLVVTNGLDIDRLDVVLFLLQRSGNVLAACLGRIGSVQRRNPHTVQRHVLHQICQSRIAGHLSLGDTVGVFRVVKGGRFLGPAQLPAVIAHVEDLRGDVVEETQEAADALGDVRLARGRQTDHDDHQLVACGGTHHLEGGGVVSLRQHVGQGIVVAAVPGVPGSVGFGIT
mmetsp:Transcript_14546/g.30945  ORF Transcript_14546/g.30945 Transcript_14546/m.30945 type:complete len:586 (+) Transcript_14546:333-2090(+)